MANDKNNAPENQSSIDNLNETLTDISLKVENNKKSITIAVVILILAVGAILLFKNYRSANATKADAAIGEADIELFNGNDTVALAKYIEVAKLGHDAGNRASLNAAILLFDQKNYEEAIKCLNDYSPKESIVGAAALSLKGDCYVNLNNYTEAVKAFNSAVKQSDKNPYYTPYFMLKLARVHRAQQDYAAEAKVYEEVLKDYPKYAASVGINIDKYLERARIVAQK